MKETGEFTRMVEKLERLYPTFPGKAATIAVNFTKERFRAQNWVDRTTEPWPKRKRPRRTRRTNNGAILVKSGRLRRSPRKVIATAEYAIVGIDVEYAQVHNDGLKVDTTQRVGNFQRKAFTRTRKGRKENVKAHTVSSHQRKLKYKMPRRQFIGQSAILDAQITRMMRAQILKTINTLNNG